MRLLISLLALAACTRADAGFTAPVGIMGHSSSGPAYDLTAQALPSGITSTRTGGATIYASRSASTVVALTGNDIYEDRGDGRGGGHWTFDAYTNSANPFNFATSPWSDGGSGTTITPSIGLGPDGATQGSRITDSSASVSQYIQVFDFSTQNDQHKYGSIWVRDSSVTPTAAGDIDIGNGNYGVAFGSGSAWRRISTMWPSSSGATYGVVFNIYPAGAVPDPRSAAGAITFDATKTGSIEVWGAQGTMAVGDVPLVNGSTAKATLSVDNPSKLLLPNGDLYIEGAFLFQANTFAEWEQPAWTLGDQYVFSVTTTNGEQGILWSRSAGAWRAEKGDGSTTVGDSWSNPMYFGAELRWEFWNRPTAGGGGANIWFNGCRYGGESDISNMRWTAVAQATPSAAYLGSQLGNANSFMSAPVTMLRRIDAPISGRRNIADPDAAEGVILADSIMAQKAYAGPMTGAFIYTFAEGRARRGIISYAVSGDTVIDQLSGWQQGHQRGRSDVKWVVIQLGVNDIAGGRTAAQIAADLSSTVADINTHNPSAQVFLAQITPCRAGITSGQYAVWQAANANIAGTGANPVTGTFTVINPGSGLNDGSDNLQSQYEDTTMDHVHPNDLGRMLEASSIRATLIGAGLL